MDIVFRLSVDRQTALNNGGPMTTTHNRKPARALAVPFKDKEEAKALGAFFVAHAKCWAVPDGIDEAPFSKWFPAQASVVSGSGDVPEEAFREALAEAGFDVAEPLMDGRFHRAKVSGDRGAEKSGSYVYIESPDGPGWYMKDHRSGETFTGKWQGGPDEAPDTENRRALRLQGAINAERRAAERDAKWAEAAQLARKTFAKLSNAEPDGATYLDRKQVGLHGAARFDGTTLVLPYQDIDGNVTTLQRIPAAEGSAKLYSKDAKKEGAFYLMGDLADGKPVLVCEGYATGASLRELSGHTVVCAGDAGSLERVCMDLRERLPSSLMLVCADDDREAVRRGKENRGMDAGIDAANLAGGHLAPPPFPEGIDGSDWNDLTRGVGTMTARAMFEWEFDQAASKEFSDMMDRLESAGLGPVGGGLLREPAMDGGRVIEVGRGWSAVDDGISIGLFENHWFADGVPPVGADISISLGTGGFEWKGRDNAFATRALFDHCAGHKADDGRVMALISAGADPNAPMERGMTALHASARAGNALVTRILIESGADLEARDDRGATPLHWAAYAGRLASATELLKAGADIDAKDRHGATPQRSAFLGKRHDTAEWLERRAGGNKEAAQECAAFR